MKTRDNKATHREHHYAIAIDWTGNLGEGTRTYAAYGRQHEITARDMPSIPASADPAFRGDASRYNPEDLFLAALSSCHMLWYLGLCAQRGVNVVAYRDAAEGRMVEHTGGGGRFTEVTLRPQVTISADSDRQVALDLHRAAHENCYIANSVNLPVRCEPRIELAPVR